MKMSKVLRKMAEKAAELPVTVRSIPDKSFQPKMPKALKDKMNSK